MLDNQRLHRRTVMAGLASFLAAPARADEPVINLIMPGVVFNAGMKEFAAGFLTEKAVKAESSVEGMGRILDVIRTGERAPDLVFLPESLMDTLEKDGGLRPNTRTPLGRVEIGLAVRKGDPIPDITTAAKFVAVLKGAEAVVYSDPSNGSMAAGIIDRLLTRPEYAGVKRKISAHGDGAEALIRGDAPMALQLICEIVNHPEIVSVGPVPQEFRAWIDTAAAVSVRSTHPHEAQEFLAYLTRPSAVPLWFSKGLVRPKAGRS